MGKQEDVIIKNRIKHDNKTVVDISKPPIVANEKEDNRRNINLPKTVTVTENDINDQINEEAALIAGTVEKTTETTEDAEKGSVEEKTETKAESDAGNVKERIETSAEDDARTIEEKTETEADAGTVKEQIETSAEEDAGTLEEKTETEADAGNVKEA